MVRWFALLAMVAFILVPVARVVGIERWVPSQYPTIQAAINASADGDEVVLEPMTYVGAGNRGLDFLGKAITVRSTNPNDPGVVASTVIDPNGADRAFYFHSGEDDNSVLNGVTIRGGLANAGLSFPNNTGGGILCYAGSPLILNCTVTDSVAVHGGGIACVEGSPTITNCGIIGNTAPAGYGGGIYSAFGAPVISNCSIAENEAGSGGGVGIWASTPTVENCLIRANSSDYGGGIICAANDRIPGGLIINCAISENHANYGGGINCTKLRPFIVNCTIARNHADDQGGGLRCDSIRDLGMTVTNCIFWENVAVLGPHISLGPSASTLRVEYSDVDGGPGAVHVFSESALEWGDGTIDADPLFVDSDGSDGDPNTWQDNAYHLSPDSPCVNAGDPNGDYTGQTGIDGDPRVLGGRVDMGADESLYCRLELEVVTPERGTVQFDPSPLTSASPYVFESDVPVVLTAEPYEGRSFKKWKVYDPADANDDYTDTNNPTTILMDRNWEIQAVFSCSLSTEGFLPVTLSLLTLFALCRRRRR